MSILGKEKYSLRYETRKDSGAFLNNVDMTQSEKNIDYFHICQAYTEIDKWFSGRDGNTKINFLNTLLNDDDAGKNVKVIWYEIGSEVNPIEIFTRINIGKIPLTNAELIKALFLGKLKENTEKAKINLKQLQIANEWDKIENALQHDSFWHFIYEGEDIYDTRIDYIFDLMTNKGSDDEKYYTFYKFNDRFIAGECVDDIWLSIKKYFQTFEEWHNDITLYHLIGFLVANKQSVTKLKDASINLTKRKYKDFLVAEIGRMMDYDIASLEYPDKRIRQVLLLFNVQMILANEHSNTRFPFNSYKAGRWDIEHIRSVKSDKPTGNKQLKWLQTVLAYFIGEIQPEEQDTAIADLTNVQEKELCSEIRKLMQSVKIEESVFTAIYTKVLAAFKEDSEPTNINTIGNLTLLSESINRSYKNAPYPIKRKTIINNYMKGEFVPFGTKNAFLKLYSSRFDNVMFWQDNDAKEYLSSIIDTLSIYQTVDKAI